MIALILACIAAFLALAVIGGVTARMPIGGPLVYTGCLVLSLTTMLAGLTSIAAPPMEMTLPIGLAFTGGHVRLDALSAFFLTVVGLGSASASLFALGYGRHEEQPQRVLPFYAGLPRRAAHGRAGRRRLPVPVLVGADVARLLGAGAGASPGSRQRPRRHDLPADGGILRLRPAAGFGLLAGTDGGYTFDAMRAAHPAAVGRRAGVDPGADRRRLESRPGAAACLAAARASRRAQPRLRADERGDDQGRRLRLHPHRVRPAGRAHLVVGGGRAGAGRHHRRAWACSTR